MNAGLGECKSLTGLPTRLHPIVDRRLDLSGLRIVVRNDLGHSLAHIGKIAAKRLSGLGVERPPLVAQEAGVGFVLYKCMLKGELIRLAASKQEAGFNQLVDRNVHVAFRQAGDRFQQSQREFATN